MVRNSVSVKVWWRKAARLMVAEKQREGKGGPGTWSYAHMSKDSLPFTKSSVLEFPPYPNVISCEPMDGFIY